MKDRMEITSLDQLRILAQPMRMRIIRLFASSRSPLSIQQMAKRLGERHGKVHYHVRRLVEGGFLEEVGQRPVNGIVERFYRMSARSVQAGPELQALPGYGAIARLTKEAIFASVEEVYREAVREDHILQVQFRDGYMTPEELNAFMDRVSRELERYEEPRPGARRFRWVTLAGIAREDPEG